jgi:hypothetical protein
LQDSHVHFFVPQTYFSQLNLCFGCDGVPKAAFMPRSDTPPKVRLAKPSALIREGCAAGNIGN